MTPRRQTARRLLLALVIPLLAFLSLAAWSLSSSAGSTPDDDFHLASIWCGLGDRAGLCENPEGDAVRRYVPTPVTTARCPSFQPAQSDACWDEDAPGMALVDRANVDRLYPPLFYGTLSLFASENVPASVMAMKLFNCAFAVGLLTAAFFALPRRLRTTFVISVVATAVPLGVFIYGSTNPSSWALLSAATVWITLLGALQTTGRRRLALAGLAVFGALIGGGARADAAVYAVFGVIVALFLGARRGRSQLIPFIAAAVIVVMSVAFYLSAWQGSAIIGGLEYNRPPLTLGQHFSNLVEVPSLWVGALGGWGLGWLDTPMPATVTVLASAVFWGAFFVGLHRATVKRSIAVAVALAALWILPLYLLGASHLVVGEVVQPRYLLPLMMIALGLASLRIDADRAWTGMRLLLAGAGLSFAFALALHRNIQRYTTGLDVFSADPGSSAEWWWANAPAPVVVWIGGSLAFAGLFVAFWIALPKAHTDSGAETFGAVTDGDAPSSGTGRPHLAGSDATPDMRSAAAASTATPGT